MNPFTFSGFSFCFAHCNGKEFHPLFIYFLVQQKQKHPNTLLPPLAIWRLLTGKGWADGLKGSPCFLLLQLLAWEPVFNPVQPLPEFQVYRGISHCSQRFSAGWFRKVQLPQFHGAPSKSSSLGWVRGVCLELFWCSKEKPKENILFQKGRINSQDHTTGRSLN